MNRRSLSITIAVGVIVATAFATRAYFTGLGHLTAWPAALAMVGIYAVAWAIALGVGYLVARLTKKGKSNGRYREAAEAHRTGTGGGTVNGPAGSTSGVALGTGASVNQIAMLAAQKQFTYSFVPTIQTTAEPKVGDFSGIGFAAGVVTGTRSFNVDTFGRLTGVYFPAIWTPDENHAVCFEANTVTMFTLTATIASAEKVREDEHDMAGCTHGFYGYYDGSNDYYKPGRIMAVVEGYGETVIGTRGFRSSKARIVALHIPQDVAEKTRRLITRNYPDVPFFDSFDAMVAEFPTDDAGQGVTPNSDPDFWTRKA